MFKQIRNVVVASTLLIGLSACGMDNNDRLAYDQTNNNAGGGAISVRNNGSNMSNFNGVTRREVNTQNVANGYNGQNGNQISQNGYNGQNRNQMSQNKDNGQNLANISASNTPLSSEKYPHTKAVLIQDAKYSFTGLNATNVNELQQQIEQELRTQFGQLTPELRQRAIQEARQLIEQSGQQQNGQQQPAQQQERQQTTQQPTQQQQQAAKQPAQQQEKQQTANTGNISQYAQEVINLTNQERARQGLPALKADSQLSSVALKKSQDMRANNYFSHTSPTYGSPFDMMRDFGVSYKTAGENIAQGQRTPQEVVQAWMNSEGHRKNIMSKDFTHIGVGYEANGHHWTQMFVGR